MSLAELVPSPEALADRLESCGYLADEGLATALFCAVRLPQPLLLEGEAGVGKTQAAKSLAAMLANSADPVCSASRASMHRKLFTNGTIPDNSSVFEMAEAEGDTSRGSIPLRSAIT
jgi:MoxR-like ATPase